MTGRSSRMLRWAVIVFARLIAFMPRTYGAEQRADAVELAAKLAGEAHDRRGNRGVVRVMVPALLDLVMQIARERMRPPSRLGAQRRPPVGDRLVLMAEAVTRDIHHGFRAMAAFPGHSAAVIGTLALGVGLNAAVFSVVDWVLLRPLPYPSPEELVRVWVGEKLPVGVPADLTSSEVRRFSTAASIRAAAAFSTVTRVTSGQGLEPVHVLVARVTGDLFGVLATYPTLGRGFDARELESGSRVVVVSHSLWRNRFASDPGIVGRIITVDNQPHTVVGIMPAGRGYPREADVWRPGTAAEREDDDRENVMIARLSRGAAHAGAMTELATLLPPLHTTAGQERAVWVDSLHGSVVRDLRTALTWVLVAAALVLLVACANVAALIGARGIDRAGELTVRGALGASSTQLVRQLVIEGVLLASAGGALGIVLGAAALDFIIAVAPGGLPRLDEITIDTRVMAVGVTMTLLIGIVVSLVPARRASRVDLRSVLGTSASLRVSRRLTARRLLVAAQMTVAVVLTVGAALLARTLQNLMAIDHGFNPQRLVAVSLNLRGTDPARARSLFRSLVDSAESVQGVRAAAVAFRLPTEVRGLRTSVRVNGMPAADSAAVGLRLVTPRYFDTVGIPLLEGRVPAATDTQQSPRVGVVNQAFGRDVLAGARAVGARLTTDLVDGAVTIVGVVADVTPAGAADRPALYMSFEQFAINAGSLLVRTDMDPTAVVPALTRRLRMTAPTQPLDRIQTMDEALAAGRSVARFNTLLASSFGLLALLLSVIGVYGLTTGEVAMRRHESSVRTALGATRGEVLLELMRPVGRLVLFGLAIGAAAAVGVTTSIRSLLYGVSPLDPLTFVAMPTLIAVVAASAAFAAARPILRADPATVLRA